MTVYHIGTDVPDIFAPCGRLLEVSDMVCAVLILKVLDGAEGTERTTLARQTDRIGDVNNFGVDCGFRLLVDFSNGLDHTKVASNATWLLVHREEREAVLRIISGRHRFRGRILASHSLVSSRVEDLSVEDGCAAWQPI